MKGGAFPGAVSVVWPFGHVAAKPCSLRGFADSSFFYLTEKGV